MARARSKGRKTDYTWSGESFGASIASATSTLFGINIFNAAATLIRVRGEIVMSIDGPVDGDKVVVGLGLKIASDDQVAAGVSAFASPATDLDADWLWHGFMPLMAQAGAGVGGSLNVQSVVMRLTVDNKAMRKVRQNQQLVLVVTPENFAGTPGTDILAGLRTLIGT